MLFRVLYGTGLRLSEALNLNLADVETRRDAADARRQEPREPHRAGHRASGRDAGELYRGRAPRPRDQRPHVPQRRGRQADKSTVYNRFRGYLADADIPHFPGGPHIHSLRHGFAVANLRRWAADGADLAVMLPYLARYMGHADLRGTQYYLQLTADAYPEVTARAQARFGYVIPAPPGDEQ